MDHERKGSRLSAAGAVSLLTILAWGLLVFAASAVRYAVGVFL